MERRQEARVLGRTAMMAALLLGARLAPAQEHKPVLGHEAPAPVPQGTSAAPTAVVGSPVPPAAVEGMIERGAYLARIGGCNDCHTPLKPGPDGPEPDVERLLSGHPESLKMPPAPKLTAPWESAASSTNTAFAGPWGVSYATNLTPDKDTGLGSWTEQIFVDTMRTGKHHGTPRAILPPMPWQNVARLTDDDLSSLYRYLTSIPQIHNRVPEAEVAAH
jgi:hypothetical protein